MAKQKILKQGRRRKISRGYIAGMVSVHFLAEMIVLSPNKTRRRIEAFAKACGKVPLELTPNELGGFICEQRLTNKVNNADIDDFLFLE